LTHLKPLVLISRREGLILDVLELTPEEVSLAFLCLVGEQKSSNLPSNLQNLEVHQWQYLAHLLAMLEEERSLSQLH
jgi:hypothetical protein